MGQETSISSQLVSKSMESYVERHVQLLQVELELHKKPNLGYGVTTNIGLIMELHSQVENLKMEMMW